MAARPTGPIEAAVRRGLAGALTGVSGGSPSRSTVSTLRIMFSEFIALPTRVPVPRWGCSRMFSASSSDAFTMGSFS